MSRKFITCLGLAGAMPFVAAAQSPDPGAPRIDVLEEVIVTATKRDVSIQDVPLAITALDARTLQQEMIRDILDVAQHVAGLSFTTALPGRTTLVLRGVSPVGGQPTVGMYLDDVPMTGNISLLQGMTQPRIFDVGRVEVLKGPQGTLYGAGSLGGAVKFVGVKPDPEGFDAFALAGVSGTEGGDTSYEAQGLINVPLFSDRGALRIGGAYRHDGGYVDRVAGGDWADLYLRTDAATLAPVERPSGNTVNAQDVNDLDSTSGKVSLLFEPSDTSEILATLNYWRTEAGDFGVAWGNLAERQQSFVLDQPIQEEVILGSLSIEKRWSGVTLNSLTGYFQRDNDLTADYTFFYRSLLGQGPFGFLFETNPGDRIQAHKSDTWSQEFRLASNDPGARLQWLAGVYGSRTENELELRLHSHGISEIIPPPLAPLVVDDVVYGSDPTSTAEQLAVFGELTYAITDKLDLTVGARWFDYQIRSRSQAWGVLNGGTGPDERLSSSEDGLNPKFTLAYAFDDDHMAYALASKGFRPGGPNIAVPTSQCAADLENLGLTEAPKSHKSDSLWNYEIGSKNTLLDQRMTLNGAIYYIDWSDIQQQVLLIGCGIPFLGNFGKAETRGAELEMEARLASRWLMGLGLAYADTEIKETVTGVTAQVGDPMLGVPELMANAYLQYEVPTGSDRTWRARVDYQYRDSQLTAFERTMTVGLQTGGTAVVPYAGRVQAAASNTDLSFGLGTRQFDYTLYVRNVFDEDVPVVAEPLRIDQSGLPRPRTYGFEVRWSP